MLNRIVLIGRLVKAPELRYASTGTAIANFTLAVNRPFSNQQGEREADFINCVVFRKPAENVANYLTKGSLAGIDGRLQTRSYEGQEGKRVFVTEVICDSVQFLDSKGANKSDNQTTNTNTPNKDKNASQGQTSANNDPFANDGKPIDLSDDDLPF